MTPDPATRARELCGCLNCQTGWTCDRRDRIAAALAERDAALAEARRERELLTSVYEAAMRTCELFADERLFTWLAHLKAPLVDQLQRFADAVVKARAALAPPREGETR